MKALVILTACGALASPLLAQQTTFRAGIDLVQFGVSVVDKQGQPIGGLTRDDFEVIENGAKQSVRFFAAGELEAAPPLHLGLLLDTSGSMADDLKDARTAALEFVRDVTPVADVTLVDFDTEVRVARFMPENYARLVERIRGRRADGMTALYDAMGVYLQGVQTLDGQKVLLVYTDGGDTTSSLTLQDALDMLKASDVTVYAIGYMQHQGSASGQQRADLDRFARLTGGLAFFPTEAKDVEKAFDSIRKEISARYSIGYVSSDPTANGAWRNVQIKLLRKDLKGAHLRTRSGYYAPYKTQ
ncbi:MAG TPA: VWA domain-containing protein [Vicinamibacterales bacterium]|nr:VWA domain-containing protein [Vicinamibacterales bacterium]